MGHMKSDASGHPHGGFSVWVDDEGEEHQVLVTCPSCQTHIDLNNEPVPDQDTGLHLDCQCGGTFDVSFAVPGGRLAECSDCERSVTLPDEEG